MTLVATLRVTSALPGATMAGTGTQVALLRVATPVRSQMSGTGTMTVALRVSSPIRSTMAGTGTMTVTLAAGGQVAMAATMSGAGALAAALRVSSPAAATMTGTGAMTVALAVQSPMAATMSGAGTLTVTLVAPVEAAPPAPAAPPRGMTTLDLASWIPVEPFQLVKPAPFVVVARRIIFRVYPAFEATAVVVPIIEAGARFAVRPRVKARAHNPVVLVRAVLIARAEVLDGRSGGHRPSTEIEDLVLTGVLPPGLALLER